MMDMEFTAKERNAIYWGGAISGAIKGVPLGLITGFVAASLLAFVVLPLAPALAPIFTSFLTTPGIGLGFFPLPLMLFNTAITSAASFFTGGHQAVAQAMQDKQNAYLDAKLMQVAGREQYLEQAVSQHMTTGMHHTHANAPLTSPRHVQKILEEGPRVRVEKQHDSMADAVADRAEDAERTIH